VLVSPESVYLPLNALILYARITCLNYFAHCRTKIVVFLISSRVLDFEWRWYRWNLLSYYYFRLLLAIFIYDRKRCRQCRSRVRA